jgi:hypothetical protein
MSMPLKNKLSVVEFKNMKFIIMDSPVATNIDSYVKELVKGRAVACVRCCEPHVRIPFHLSLPTLLSWPC